MKTFASSLFAGSLEHLNSSLADLADMVLVQAGSGAEEALRYFEGQYLMKDSARLIQSLLGGLVIVPGIRPSASVAGAFL